MTTKSIMAEDLQLWTEGKHAGGQAMTFHGNEGSISSQIPGDQDTQTHVV
jgi:hypothetical protein